MDNDPFLAEWVAKIESRLKVNPHDAEGWFALARDAQKRDVVTLRPFWERAVSHFPTHPYFWMMYIEQEIKAGHFEAVDALFNRCLHKIPSIELSRQYVRYIILTKPPSNLANREKIHEAYVQAIDRVGLDFDAAALYLDFVRFLREGETISAHADQYKGFNVRKIFHQAVTVPMAGIELVWKEYCNFEHEFQPHNAERIIAEKNREFTLARKHSKTLEQLIRILRREKLPSPPRTVEEERYYIDNWRKWMSFERGNPLLLDDELKISKRLAYVYENCLMCMPYRIDLWLETAAHYRETADKALQRGEGGIASQVLDSAILCLERGIVLYPERAIFYLVIADFEESRKNHERVAKVYERCLKRVQNHRTLVWIHYMFFMRRAHNISEARGVFKNSRDPDEKALTQEMYVAAALMEFFSTNQKSIPLNIFEAGLKRFSSSITVDYVRIYLDFLMLQNEHSNAKILIEKALAMDSLSVHDKLLIAGKGLDYESFMGDYNSIQRMERSRTELTALLDLPSTTSRIASQYVTRWNYMKLSPLTENDLRNMDYFEMRDPAGLVPPSSFGMFKNQTAGGSKAANEKKFSMPDVGAMIAFKPRSNNRGYCAVKGGDYVLPESVESLKRNLPPPESFAGPFPDLDQLFRLIIEEEPKSSVELQKAGEGIDAGLQMIARIVEMGDDSEMERVKSELDPERRLGSDIYRLRQAKKMKTEGHT